VPGEKLLMSVDVLVGADRAFRPLADVTVQVLVVLIVGM
jgi:hypothetical protein